eukprot:jgi/Chlat1/3903/Chrsp26S04173
MALLRAVRGLLLGRGAALVAPRNTPLVARLCSTQSSSSTTSTSSNGIDGAEAVRQQVDDINERFGEAREEIEMAMESKETVYFNEEAEIAHEAVQGVLSRYEKLLVSVGESQRGQLERAMGLKMEQLKAELAQLQEHD